ncbi:MAG: coproporphyrinogen III oxidase [Bacteroidales bacterium]|nr:MAG: coproporphyrinogen III oxidase [Bacteroidales bacterium]
MLYIHIPFCKSRCIYCNFFSSISLMGKKKYVDAICSELEQRSNYLNSNILDTIYLGGGTPSLLEYDDLKMIFAKISEIFTISHNAEITLECNPDDINTKFISQIKQLPINRISLGVQSFDDEELLFLKRRHSAAEAKQSVRLLQKSGFKNISIDLMYSLPKQTNKSWYNSLSEALTLDIQHISAYSLTYEKNTKLYRMLKQKEIESSNDNDSLEFFRTLRHRLLENGFEHYEISNFARTDFHSRHNSGYWQNKQYLGIGASAHSYNGYQRCWNIPNIEKYCNGIFSHNPNIEREVLSDKERYNETIFLSLRTMKGIDLSHLEAIFGKEKLKLCINDAKKYIENSLLENVNNHLRLTEKGIFLSDGIMSDFMIC